MSFEEVLFCLVILCANIIQGITGFAGTILAMPASLHLVGMDVAVPVLNVLGLLSGIYVFLEKRKHVLWREVAYIVCVMGISILGGVLIKSALAGHAKVLYVTLGVIVIALAVKGLIGLFLEERQGESIADPETGTDAVASWETLAENPVARQRDGKALKDRILVISAGVVHGMFVCGGPLLIGYLTGRVRKKEEFRATISTVWIFLNGLLLGTHLIQGIWSLTLLKIQLITVPFLLLGMWIGSLLAHRMKQRTFMILTYVLLLVSGLSLFLK
ncbi:MAG: sulfite exporter TauE/SafE family protein [Lachnospiraceae bacterium]|nr:sulfite exporter TauE/SafE family protein [Lachnospiraceae bacterium]